MYSITDGSEKCECHRCINENDLTGDVFLGGPLPLNACKMILCGECGNKRCPKASDHRHACTGSNESGQAGSVYASSAQTLRFAFHGHSGSPSRFPNVSKKKGAEAP